MNNDEQQLDALTGQTVTISLGGRSYQARRATLYDVGLMNRKRKELQDKNDTGNIDMDVTIFILYELLKDFNKAITSPEDLAKLIPFDRFQDVVDSMSVVGFKLPQKPESQVAGA